MKKLFVEIGDSLSGVSYHVFHNHHDFGSWCNDQGYIIDNDNEKGHLITEFGILDFQMKWVESHL